MNDNQIMNRPKCQTEGCNGIAITLIADKWRCGECLVKVVNKIKERTNDLFITE